MAHGVLGDGVAQDRFSLCGRMTGRRVLILGGTGFIGREVATTFRDSGVAVRSLSRDLPADLESGVEFVLGAAEDRTALEEALDGVDWVVHSVGCPPPAASPDDFDSTVSNIQGLDTLLEVVRRRPGVGLTFVSSGGAVYGNADRQPVSEGTRCRPISAYGLAKLMAEDSIAAYSARYGIPARILRVANAYGPRQDASGGQGVVAALFRAAESGEPVPVFDGGRAIRDYVHVADVARAVVALRPCVGEQQLVNVGSGVGHSVTQLLQLTEELTGITLNVDWRPRRPSDVDAVVLDVTRLRRIMPWHPQDLKPGMAEVWEARSAGAVVPSGAVAGAGASEQISA